MTYGPDDYAELERLLTPTPERLQTAKAWLARRIRERGGVGPEGTVIEFAAEQGAVYPFSGEGQVDPRFPESQERLIPYWQWVQALRYAIADLARIGLLLPVVSADWNPRESPPFFSTEGPRIPLGEVGQQRQPTGFQTPALYSQYRVAPISEAALEQRLVLYDADLFAVRARLDAFGERVQRSVREALAAYQADLFLAAANMLGAASEAAWYEVGQALEQAGSANQPLRDELASLSPRAATVAEEVAASLLSAFPTNSTFEARFGFRRADLGVLGETARYWRDQRNWATHPVGSGIEAFTDAALAVQLMGAATYLNRLAALTEGIRNP